MKIKYTGTADYKVYTAADFKKADIDDGKKITFERGEVTEVPDNIGEALIAKDGLFGREHFEQVEDEAEVGTEGEVDEGQGELPWVERHDDDAPEATDQATTGTAVPEAAVKAAEVKATSTSKASRSK